jgi:hypothetical protein
MSEIKNSLANYTSESINKKRATTLCRNVQKLFLGNKSIKLFD